MKGIIVSVPLWGELHIRRFFSYGLPSLMASGNLPALHRALPLTILFPTHGEDRPLIEALMPPGFAATYQVEFDVVTPDLASLKELLHPGGHSGTMLKELTNRAIVRCVQEDKALSPMAGDVMYCNNWGENIVAAIGKGKRALMSVGTNFPEGFLAFADMFRRRDGEGDVISIPPLDMCKAWLDLTAAAKQPASIDEDAFVYNPANLRWPAGSGVLVRPFHLNPNFVYPQRTCRMRNGADHDLVNQVLSSPVQLEFAQDATTHIFGGVDGLGSSAPSVPVPFKEGQTKGTVLMAAQYMAEATWDWYRDFAWLQCWYHDGKMTHMAKARAMAESDAFIEAAYDEFQRMCAPARTEL